MTTTYDPWADAISVRCSAEKIVDTQEIAPGIILDFGADGEVVAVEILDAGQRLDREGLLKASGIKKLGERVK